METREQVKSLYSVEFQSEAVKLVLKQGLSIAAAAKRLTIPKSRLGGWVKMARSGQFPSMPGTRTVAELETEVTRLRRELVNAQLERDILKKATAYFAKESQKGTRT